jgi:hypothetical protein
LKKLIVGLSVLIMLVGCSSPPALLPDLVGLEATAAKLELAELGIRYSTVEEESSVAEEGQVLRTSPVSGSELEDSVVLYVSSGVPYAKPKETPTVEPVWWPTGYAKFDKDIAYKFVTEEYRGDACGYSGCSFFVVDVVSRNGCSGGVYGKINVLKSGKVVDWTNETLAGLRAGQVGEMVFTVYGLGSGSFTGQLVDFSCYR